MNLDWQQIVSLVGAVFFAGYFIGYTHYKWLRERRSPSGQEGK